MTTIAATISMRLAQGESDPLAELARLIGQTDPFAGMGRANQQVQPRAAPRTTISARRWTDEPARGPAAVDAARDAAGSPAAGLPHRMIQPAQDYPSAVHPLQRYARPACRARAGLSGSRAAIRRRRQHEPDPSRYDDALYGQLDSGAQQAQHDPAYADDPYAYQDGYDDGAEEPVQKRRGGMITVAVVLALAVVGTGGAFAYRTYVGSPRSGEPPIIKADTSPTKIMPAPADGSTKVPDRLAAGDGTEKIVPREEAPVDVNANTGPAPRVVFPPLNQNANPPSLASVAPSGAAAGQRQQRHVAEQRAAQDQDLFGPRRPGRCSRGAGRGGGSAAGRETSAGGTRRCACAATPAGGQCRAPMRRCRWRRRPPSRPRSGTANPDCDQCPGRRSRRAPPRGRRRISGSGFLAAE